MCQLLGASYSRPPIDPYLTSPCYKILASPLGGGVITMSAASERAEWVAGTVRGVARTRSSRHSESRYVVESVPGAWRLGVSNVMHRPGWTQRHTMLRLRWHLCQASLLRHQYVHVGITLGSITIIMRGQGIKWQHETLKHTQRRKHFRN